MLHDEANVPRSAFDTEPESSWVSCFFSLLSATLIGHFAYICALFFFSPALAMHLPRRRTRMEAAKNGDFLLTNIYIWSLTQYLTQKICFIPVD